jgi:hypothetical protein
VCLQGASAFNRMLQEFSGTPIRVFVIWEPVLKTDWTRPSTMALGRIADLRTAQFWDKGRLISHEMGERDRRSIVWDHISIYPKVVAWTTDPPQSLYHGGPVVRVIDPARKTLVQALQQMPRVQ